MYRFLVLAAKLRLLELRSLARANGLTVAPTHSSVKQTTMKHLLILLIKFYQYFISPWLGKNCCFHPTCSSYAYEAINNHGTIKGLFFALKRLLKCHPFTDGGYDPVPKKLYRRRAK